MSEERQRKIQEWAWHREALTHRERIRSRLGLPVPAFDFLGDAESLEFGKRYWAEARARPLTEAAAIEIVLEDLERAHANESVLWLHRYADDAGAICLPLARLRLLLADAGIRTELGPDILFAAADLRFGCCYERGENEALLRAWDVL